MSCNSPRPLSFRVNNILYLISIPKSHCSIDVLLTLLPHNSFLKNSLCLCIFHGYQGCWSYTKTINPRSESTSTVYFRMLDGSSYNFMLAPLSCISFTLHVLTHSLNLPSVFQYHINQPPTCVQSLSVVHAKNLSGYLALRKCDALSSKLRGSL